MAQPRTDGEPWTVARLLNWTRDHFQRSGIEAPRLCAEILLAHAMGCQRIHLYTRYEQCPDDAILTRFRESVRDAARGRPIAQITGHKEFYSLDFIVTPDVLVPRPETEVLVERTLRLVKEQPDLRRILDLGTGSGCIAITLAKHLPDATIVASDLSPAALAVARQNAAKHELAARVRFVEGDLFDFPGAADDPFDIIVANPPYIGREEAADLPATVRDFEPEMALFADNGGLAVFERLAAEAPAHLSPQGHLLVEVAWNQAAAVRELFNDNDWPAVSTYRDALGHERVVHAARAAAAATTSAQGTEA